MVECETKIPTIAWISAFIRGINLPVRRRSAFAKTPVDVPH